MIHKLRMAIIRTVGAPITRNYYNSQEIGLARGLSLYDLHVDVYVAGKESEVKCQIIDSDGSGCVRLIELPFSTIPEIEHALYPKLISMLKDGKYDFIQVNEEHAVTSFLVARFAHRQGIPVVVYQGMYEQITGSISVAFQKFYDWIFLPVFRQNISMALAKTTRAQKHLERKGFTNTRVIPVGLDPTNFTSRKDRNWRSEFDIAAENSILLYVGVFEKRRNVDFMLNMAKRFTGDEITLVMAGIGPEHDRILARVSEEKLKNVRLVGQVTQECLPSLYQVSSILLLPSNYEIYGMVVLEAMYFGVPVLSTCTAGPEDIIDNHVDGILMNGLNDIEWANVIRELLSKPEKLTAMSDSAKQKIINTLLWSEIAYDYYASVIKPLVGCSNPLIYAM